MSQTQFSDLYLIEPLLRALSDEGYTQPTPIQEQAIPHLLDGGDLLGCAQTGTGKTAAFALPLLQYLHQTKNRPSKRSTRSLILTPTRELALQIGKNFQKYGHHLNLNYATIYGGVNQNPQVRALAKGVDVLIATPGRLLDLLNQKLLRLDEVETLVLDEADRMLDMGFIRDVQKIVKVIPNDRQTLLFSATMPREVSRFADDVLSNPKKIQVNPVSSTAELIDDYVLFVEQNNKKDLLLEVLRQNDIERVIVFTRTKHRANRISRIINDKGIRAEAIHGNKSQNARQKALKEFSAGKVKVLVATDIVARGIDVSGVSHVINFELPNEPESYVHRIGRTARGGAAGIAISFCAIDELEYFLDIEKMLKRKVHVADEHEYHAVNIAEMAAKGLKGPGKPKRKPQNNPRKRSTTNNRGRSKPRSRSSQGTGQRSSRSGARDQVKKPPRRRNAPAKVAS